MGKAEHNNKILILKVSAMIISRVALFMGTEMDVFLFCLRDFEIAVYGIGLN